MLTLATAIGLRRLLEKQMTKRKRSPLEYIVLAMLGCVLAATIKYPNRAFLTHARPDLKAKGRDAPGYPLVGNLPDIIKARNDPLQMLHDTLREYGDVISITLPFLGRAIIINRPDLMEYVLKTNFENYVKGDLFRWHLVDILGRGIFVSDSDEWRFHRKTASNLFTTKLYRSLVQGAFQSSANDLSRVLNAHIDFPSPRCKDNEMNPLNAIDLQAQFLKLTLDAFGKLTFGLDFQALAGQSPQGPAGRGGGGGEHSHEFGDAFDFLTSAADARLSNPLWWLTEKLMPGNWKRHWDAIGVLDNYAERAVRQRRTETAEEREMRARDLLDHFIGYKNDDGTMLTDRELRDVFVNFMVAGRDTTAQALTWQFYCLMANPRVMKNLVQEIDSVLQGSEEGIKYEVLMNEMPYAKAVLHETLRLHPPVPKNVKQAVADDVLPDGTRIYKGEFIGYSSWCMARNQAVWGVDAEMFVPERWLVPDESSKNQSDRSSLLPSSLFGKFRAESHFKFNSFNAGPRLCLGQTFAILEAMVTTCILLQRFEFKLIPNHPVPTVKRSITLPMKKPLMTIVTRRENTSALHQR